MSEAALSLAHYPPSVCIITVVVGSELDGAELQRSAAVIYRHRASNQTLCASINWLIRMLMIVFYRARTYRPLFAVKSTQFVEIRAT